MNLPSKELLIEVIGKEISAVKLSQFDAVGIKSFDCITYSFEDNYRFDDVILSINIYELAHKCKEWAFCNIKRSISSEYHKNGFRGKTSWRIGIEFGNCPEYFVADTEPEAIFKACQWILENR